MGVWLLSGVGAGFYWIRRREWRAGSASIAYDAIDADRAQARRGVKARLRIRAAENGRSMEAEARAILAAALLDGPPEKGLGTWIHERFADLGGVELDLPDRDEPARAAELPE